MKKMIISELPVELIHHICSFLDEDDYLTVIFTHYLFRTSSKREIINKDLYFEMKEKAIRKNEIDILKYMKEVGLTFTSLDMTLAAHLGRAQIVEFIFWEELYPVYGNFIRLFDDIDIMRVCRQGWTDVLKFLHDRGIEYQYDHLRCACKHGNLQVVQYLTDLGLPLNYKLMDLAAEHGQLETVAYLHDMRIEVKKALSLASKEGHLQVVKFLCERKLGMKRAYQAMNNASRKGHLDIVKYLHRQGIPLGTEAYDLAKENEHEHVIEYMINFKEIYDFE